MLLHPSALDKVVRAPFKVAEPIVKYELIKMPDSAATGFGYYVETS